MATDLYAKCPCGSGKKIKFCCKDIITDIERIERMLQGEQRTSALERINKLLEKHPDRPALLSLRAQVLLELESHEEADATLDRLLEVEPTNSPALAMKGSLAAAQGDFVLALRHLHHSLRCADGVLSQIVYRSYLAICFHLIQSGEVVAAYAHLLTLVSITRGQDRTSISMLMQVTSSNRLPAIFHGLLIADDAPEGSTWKREFDVAIDMYRHGDWSESARLLEDMANRILDEPTILRNLAILQAWTCQDEKAIKSFRYCASIRDFDENLAVEAEACAQVLEATSEEDTDELVAISHDIEDANALMERLLSADNVDSIPVQRDPNTDTPPPKGQFVVYDKALLPESKGEESEQSDEQIDFDVLPVEKFSITLFGKETDRSARFTIVGLRDDGFSDLLKLVEQVTGETVKSDDENTDVVSRVHRVERLFRPNFRVPQQTKLETYKEAQRKWIVGQLENEWPAIPLTIFDGKCAKEAAGERKLKRKVLAAILNLELWADRQPFTFEFDQLRTKLGLDPLLKIDPADVDVRGLTSTQIRRLELEKLKDEDLKFIFEVVSVRPNGALLYRISQEVLSRPSMEEHVDLIEVHERMADLASSSDEQLDHLGKARDLAVSKGESPASWLIAELDLRIQRGEGDAAKRLIAEIQSRYLKEPGIAQMFMQVLSKYGLMPQTPGAMPGTVPPEAMQAVPAEAAVAGAAATPAASGGVWTPGGGSSTPPASEGEGGGESKIWVPD